MEGEWLGLEADAGCEASCPAALSDGDMHQQLRNAAMSKLSLASADKDSFPRRCGLLSNGRGQKHLGTHATDATGEGI